MKQIELFGCTGAGKTTFAKYVTEIDDEHGNNICSSDTFLLEKTNLSWIKNKFLLSISLDAYLLVVFLLTMQKYKEFIRFFVESLIKIKIPFIERINILRNFIKRIGAYEIIRRSLPDQQIILVDGGTLQIAHHLFVHVAVPVCNQRLHNFIEQVPLPEAAIYFTEDQANLVDRTIKRGHKRVPDQSPEKIEKFIKNGVQTFEELVYQLESLGKMTPIEGQHKTYVLATYLNELSLITTLRRINGNFKIKDI